MTDDDYRRLCAAPREFTEATSFTRACWNVMWQRVFPVVWTIDVVASAFNLAQWALSGHWDVDAFGVFCARCLRMMLRLV